MTKIAPTRTETALLQPFPTLGLENIVIPTTPAQFAEAAAVIAAAGVVGFDTESKPVFLKETVNEGPHVVQFATMQTAYVFQLRYRDCIPYLREILTAKTIIKVGFGLRSDRGQLNNKLQTELNGILDMITVFRAMGYPGDTGLRSAVGIVFKQKFHKSKKTTTSNWGAATLNDRQLVYAANDAYVALRVLQALALPREQWPVIGA